MSNIFILHGVEYEIGYQDYLNNEIKNEIHSFFNSKQYQISNKEFSYRIINHWEKNNLITSSRREGSGWRKYSIMDKIWLYIIREMRNFEISLKMIQKVKSSLTQKKKDAIFFPLLEYYIAQAMLNRPVFLMIFTNGQAHPVTEREFQMNRELSSSHNHLQINLNQIVQKIFPWMDLKVNYKGNSDLNFEEKRAILLLKMGNFKELELTEPKQGIKIFRPENESHVKEACSIIRNKQFKHLKFTLYSGRNFQVNAD